jgi:hypothetical protein
MSAYTAWQSFRHSAHQNQHGGIGVGIHVYRGPMAAILCCKLGLRVNVNCGQYIAMLITAILA